MIDIELQRTRSAMAESVTLPIAMWLEALDELEALRQTSLVQQAEQEPVAEWEKLKDPQTLFVNLNRGFPAQLTHDHLLHLLNKTEQAEQEPVACIECGRPTMSAESKCNDCHSMDDAAPVRTKDLTDDEICEIGKATQSVEGERYLPVTFARAVIAADREKNNANNNT